MGYYFISIGGSGARVLESLTHLCVAGLLPNKEKQGHLYTMEHQHNLKDSINRIRPCNELRQGQSEAMI